MLYVRRLLVLATVLSLTTCGGFVQRGGAQTHQIKVYTNDWITATRIVGKYYGSNVRNWLVNCSSSEGSHGRFVWYAHLPYPKFGYSHTPGGWMQFMGSTFRNNMGWTLANAKRRGLRIHPKARSYYEPLGQAVVAGVMYKYHGNPGTWTGGSC